MDKYKVHSLICHRDVKTACSCLGSLLRSVPADLILHDDGTLTAKDCEAIKSSLPGTEIIKRVDADRMVADLLASYPNCYAARSNPLMLKLLDVALLSEDYIAYCDTDVYFFRPVEGLFDLIDGELAVFMRDLDHAYSVRPWHLWPIGKLRLPRHLNSGLFVFPRNKFDLGYCEWLLSKNDWSEYFKRISCWAEQTCWAALAFRAGCRLFSGDQFPVVDQGWARDEKMVAAHFISSHRGLLLELLKHGEDASITPNFEVGVRVGTDAVHECNAFAMALSQVRRRAKRLADSILIK